jgi:hypothetical protein
MHRDEHPPGPITLNRLTMNGVVLMLIHLACSCSEYPPYTGS